MNKLFTKIAALALGATMATGVGVAVASNSEYVKPADAAVIGTNLVQVTSLTSGNQYVIVGNNNGYALPTKPTVSSGKVAGTAIADVPADGSGYLWTFTKSGDYWLIGDGSKYIYHSNGGNSGTNLAYGTSQASYPWNLTYSTSSQNHWKFAGVVASGPTVKTRGMLCNGTNFGGYALSNESSYKYMNIYSVAATKTLSSIAVSGYKTAFTVGDTFSFGGTVTATYSNSSTANVTSSATFSGYNMSTAGSQTVTASYTEGGVTKTATYGITVSAPTSPYITPAKASTSGYTGQNETLSFTYGNLTSTLGVTSSNTSVVTVDTPSYSAGSGTVQLNFVGAGSTTVKFKDGSTELASVSVSVTASSVTITGLAASGSVYIGKTLNLGSTITVTATGIYSSDVTWESDDDSIATVSAAGVVTGVADGTVDITVTSDDYPSATMTCSVTVSEQPLEYVMTYGSNKNTNPTEIKTNEAYHSTYSSVDSDVTAGDFSKIYGISSSQLKCGSGSASAQISFTIPSTSYITSVVVVVANAGGTSLNVTSSADGASTENQTIAVGTLTFDDYLATEKSNKVTLASTASGAFYLSSITINYANFTPELHASSTHVEAAVNTSNQSIDLTYDYFTPTGYTAVVKSGSSLTAGAVAFNTSVTPHTATFTTGSTTGATVFTITGTGGGKSASVDVTVTVTEVRNLLTLTISTASDATSFKVGDAFDVGSLVITATFDAAPTTVVYSKANDNLGALTFAPAIGYEFLESDIGTVTSVIAELEVGTGDEYVEYTISVSDKTYAAQVTSVTDLWDGQQIYFGASDGSKVNVAHAGGNQLTSQEANVHETKGLCVDDLEHKTPYTVHREQISGVTYYSFQNDGYYLEASSTSSNYLTRTDTLSDNCRYIISISSGEVTMTNKGNSSRPEFRWNSGSSWFSQYQTSSTLDKAVIYAITSYSEQAVADSFAENWLHMSDYNSNLGWCADEEHAYYANLKPVWAAMGEYEKAALSAAAQARLEAWAAANGEHLDSDMNLVANTKINPIALTNGSSDSNAIIIVVITAVISLSAIGGYFFLRKRREQN